MKNVEEQAERQALTDDLVLQYLRQHPDFFIRHSHQTETMRIPHPVRGSVSLVEWQLARQRQRIQYLEEEIALLTEQATRNEELFSQLLQLQMALSTAASLQELLDRLHRWARKLGLSGAAIRLFTDRWRIGAPSDFTHLALNRTVFEPLRIQRLGERHHYLGTLNGPELLLLLPQARHVGSVALSLMGKNGDLGLLIFSSRDSHHYQDGMGTDLLQHLATIIPVLLERWIERL
ncbi:MULTISPECIES: DUF484 domain-containing protein [Dickeya]|uniref:DUF484 domain-containing protein n=1 Tax=Dickeya TaxID=204037 RepID=UPI00039BCA89|nr:MULTISPECIES: DUF484 domain-containing protein [Dickeya]AYH49865.1 DUF484 family protein [Dickeya fangzhongdai]MBO8133303.1 DUF484 domain-containing protein [Dickeya fangzhongdai]UGA50796.1 DUF484 domain-containing protein [Dickeya fangzhongdai]ULR30855.1 DUF484 domain-containing protein [Dickeya fangzhongdai]UWH07151.1 DUF484 domain-containing protein [Dickeya fangzhongdai]